MTPVFDPDVSTLDWVTDVYPNLPPQSKPIECVLHPGEVRDTSEAHLLYWMWTPLGQHIECPDYRSVLIRGSIFFNLF